MNSMSDPAVIRPVAGGAFGGIGVGGDGWTKMTLLSQTASLPIAIAALGGLLLVAFHRNTYPFLAVSGNRFLFGLSCAAGSLLGLVLVAVAGMVMNASASSLP